MNKCTIQTQPNKNQNPIRLSDFLSQGSKYTETSFAYLLYRTAFQFVVRCIITTNFANNYVLYT